VRYSNTDIETLLDKYPGVRDSIPVSHKKQGLLPKSLLTALHYLISQKDQEAANVFVEGMLHGRNLDERNPVYVLRERLLQNTLAKAKLPPSYIFALAIKAWNACRAKAEVKCLRYVEAESFPLVA
jgi:hypothetical protein